MSFVLKSAVLLIAYLAAAKVGLEFSTMHSGATVFWPPGGIALAALLIGGIRYLPAIFVGACLSSMMVEAPTLFAAGSALGNTLETFLGYYLIKRFGAVDLSLSRLRDLFLVILLGGLIPAIAGAALGSLSLLASGTITQDMLPAVALRWWRADVLGITFLTPLILMCVKECAKRFWHHRSWEIIALWLTSFLVGQAIFLGWPLPVITVHQPIGLVWIFPLLAWAGLRTGRRNTAFIQLMFISQSLLSAYLGTGYFADDLTHYGLANFWMFAMLLAVMGLTLAIQSAVQRNTMLRLDMLAKVFSISNDGIVITDGRNNIVAVNPAFTTLTGYTAAEVVGKNPRFLSSGKQDHEFYAGMWKTLIEIGHWKGEIWNRRKNGEAYLEKLAIYTLNDSDHKVVNRIGIFSDITLDKAQQESVAHQAQHDYLTNLPNRLLFRDRFNQQAAIAKRRKNKFAVIFLDLDQFKPVNDTFGHQVGDQLLIAVAQRLTSLVREIDTVSRFGGDEFAILVSEVTAHQDIERLIEKIKNELAHPFILDGQPIRIACSLGVALYPDDGPDLNTIMEKADAAMYQAKQNSLLK